VQLAEILRRRLGINSIDKLFLYVAAMLIGDNPKGEVFMSEHALADAMECTTRTVENATARLEQRGLIDFVSGPRNGRACNTWRLCIGAIWSLAGVVLNFFDHDHNRSTFGSHDTANRSTFGSPPLIGEEEIEEGGNPLTPFWEKLERALYADGVGGAQAAVGIAQANGVTPDHVAELIEHWRANKSRWKFPVAVIYRRIELARPDLPIADGWKPFDAPQSNPAAIHSSEKRYWHRQEDR
jgi:hypothetical protein